MFRKTVMFKYHLGREVSLTAKEKKLGVPRGPPKSNTQECGARKPFERCKSSPKRFWDGRSHAGISAGAENSTSKQMFCLIFNIHISRALDPGQSPIPFDHCITFYSQILVFTILAHGNSKCAVKFKIKNSSILSNFSLDPKGKLNINILIFFWYFILYF